MKKILVTGAGGQIGTDLVEKLGELYGAENVIISDINPIETDKYVFEKLDVTDKETYHAVVKKHGITEIYHLAAILSAVGEKNPDLLWHVNMTGLEVVLNIAREEKVKVFVPSSIAAFGPSTPADKTPQVTIQRPTTIYGISKVAGELLCDYYHQKFGVDVRGVRFPGLISHKQLPGGGTTDYAVHIYFDAIKKKSYTSYIGEGTYMDMLYMDDAIDSMINIMNADPSKLKHRNAYNISAMSIAPEDVAKSIQKVMPDFVMDYDVDPVRQAIAESWPNSLDDSAAREDWGWDPKFDLDKMTVEMLEAIKKK